MHINNIATLGENKWYDGGDERFHPDNIIFDARNSNILGIISKKTGDVVWRLGPDFNENEATRKLGWIIGQHHLHMIPKGLPGEGDLLVFDNGGEGGYGVPNPASPTGVNNAHRDYSRSWKNRRKSPLNLWISNISACRVHWMELEQERSR